MELLCTTPLDPVLRGLPPSGARDYIGRLRSLLSGARRTVDIVCPFIDERGVEFLETVFRAASGARWEILTRQPKPALRDAAQRCGWTVRQYKGTRGRDPNRGFHCKFFVADGAAAIVGSSNLVYHNLVENLELGVYLDETSELAALARIVRVLKRACQPAA